MEDGTAPSNERQVTVFLRSYFGDERVISRGFPIALNPRFLALNLRGFWL